MHDLQVSSIQRLARDLKQIHEKLGDEIVSPLMDAIDDTEGRIAGLAAQDKADAAVQLMLVQNGLENLAEQLDGDCQTLIARLSILVSSALRVLVSESRVDLSEFGSDWYLPQP